jgi:hypothetical protein
MHLLNLDERAGLMKGMDATIGGPADANQRINASVGSPPDRVTILPLPLQGGQGPHAGLSGCTSPQARRVAWMAIVQPDHANQTWR